MNESASTRNGVGLGLRWDFLDEVLAHVLGGEVAGGLAASLDEVPFFEVAPENHMRRGGYYPEALAHIAGRYPLLTHGLAMSLGSREPADDAYFEALRSFVREVGSPFHSDHLCFCGTRGRALHDLLPLPRLRATAQRVADNLRAAEDRLGVPMAVENITYYLVPGAAPLPEAEHLAMVLERSGARLLLDVNNVYVNAKNHGFSALDFLRSLPLERVAAIHVAGHERSDEHALLIDSHGAPVLTEVESLLAWVLERTGPLPVILERDHHLPPLAELLAERRRLADVYARSVARFAGDSAPRTFAPELVHAPFDDAEEDRAERLSEALERTVLAADAPRALATEPARFFREVGLSAADADAFAALGERRLLVYRKLVRRGLVGAVRVELPRSAAALGEAFSPWVERFLDEAPPASRYLRDVAFAFVTWLLPRLADAPELPAYLGDLARYELASFAVGVAERGEIPEERRPFALDRPVRWDGTAALLRLGHDVQRELAEPPRAARLALLFFRDLEGEVHELPFPPLEGALLAALRTGAALGAALTQAASAEGQPVDAALLERVSALLADLTERGILFGAA
jgi:uncharacterized protein (UPF0276 family)